MNAPLITRRRFLATAAASAGALVLRPAFTAAAATPPALSFFLIGVTHYFADADAPDQLDSVSAQYNSRFVDLLNRLPGSAIPEAAGGGLVASPKGVIHAGDLIHDGDKNGGAFPTMQKTELAAYVADWGLTGTEGRLKYPVYEVFGNHDAPHGQHAILDPLAARARLRTDLTHLSANALHYSWDWGPIHFINLGITVGSDKREARPKKFDPLGSLEFLIEDLAANVGNSGRAVVITHHVNLGSVFKCDPAAPNLTLNWDPCDLRAYWDAIKGANVVAMLYGHTHKRATFRWDGEKTTGPTGVPVFNTASAAHFDLKHHAFFYFEVTERELVAREYATDNGLETAAWAPQVWRVPLEQRAA